jgi:hypothetical protein
VHHQKTRKTLGFSAMEKRLRGIEDWTQTDEHPVVDITWEAGGESVQVVEQGDGHGVASAD